MPWHSRPPVIDAIEYLPRARPRRLGVRIAAYLGVACIVAAFLLLAGSLAALLLRLATILLTVALVAGVIAFAAFRIGIAPRLGARRPG